MRIVGIGVLGVGVWVGLAGDANAQTRIVVPIVVAPGATAAAPAGGRPAPAQPAGPQTINITVRDGGRSAVERAVPGPSAGSTTNVNVTVRAGGRATVERAAPKAAGRTTGVNIVGRDGVAVETPIVVPK